MSDAIDAHGEIAELAAGAEPPRGAHTNDRSTTVEVTLFSNTRGVATRRTGSGRDFARRAGGFRGHTRRTRDPRLGCKRRRPQTGVHGPLTGGGETGRRWTRTFGPDEALAISLKPEALTEGPYTMVVSLQDGRVVRRLEGGMATASVDGTRLATDSLDGVRVFAWPELESLSVLPVKDAATMQFSPGGNLLFTGSLFGSVVEWDILRQTPRPFLEQEVPLQVRSLSHSDDGGLLLAATMNYSTRGIRIEGGTKQYIFDTQVGRTSWSATIRPPEQSTNFHVLTAGTSLTSPFPVTAAERRAAITTVWFMSGRSPDQDADPVLQVYLHGDLRTPGRTAPNSSTTFQWRHARRSAACSAAGRPRLDGRVVCGRTTLHRAPVGVATQLSQSLRGRGRFPRAVHNAQAANPSLASSSTSPRRSCFTCFELLAHRSLPRYRNVSASAGHRAWPISRSSPSVVGGGSLRRSGQTGTWG
jgi:hypothetical protein